MMKVKSQTFKQWLAKIGMGRYTMAEYEKIKQLTIPLGIDHVMVTANHMEHTEAP